MGILGLSFNHIYGECLELVISNDSMPQGHLENLFKPCGSGVKPESLYFYQVPR